VCVCVCVCVCVNVVAYTFANCGVRNKHCSCFTIPHTSTCLSFVLGVRQIGHCVIISVSPSSSAEPCAADVGLSGLLEILPLKFIQLSSSAG
jgi:hypothetical protein